MSLTVKRMRMMSCVQQAGGHLGGHVGGHLGGHAAALENYIARFDLAGLEDEFYMFDDRHKRGAMCHNTQRLNSGFNSFKGDDVDGGLVADFDGSLSTLGVQLGSNSHNISEALLALPMLKTEPSYDQGLENLLAAEGRRLTVLSDPSAAGRGDDESPTHENVTSTSVACINSVHWAHPRFQYVLNAATSPATKVNEENLTYLNQGQPYEVKLKLQGDKGDLQGKRVRSVIRVIFHERHLQYMEREQIVNWERARPGERILDLDIPLSYGVANLKKHGINAVEFLWDPTKTAGIYVKVNCISTEFTAKKHGGEKGVPFRLQVESYLSEAPSAYRLYHCASCQIKVFKPKGADRKHKTDREKLEKRGMSERDVYHPSYEYTVLTEIPLDQAKSFLTQITKREQEGISSERPKSRSPVAPFGERGQGRDAQSPTASSMPNRPYLVAQRTKIERGSPPLLASMGSSLSSHESDNDARNFACISDDSIKSGGSGQGNSKLPTCVKPLLAEASAQEVTQWLAQQRSSKYTKVFHNFTGADLLRLSRDDLIQICGLADGIRLNNALLSKAVRPKLTLYLCQEQTTPRTTRLSADLLPDNLRGPTLAGSPTPTHTNTPTLVQAQHQQQQGGTNTVPGVGAAAAANKLKRRYSTDQVCEQEATHFFKKRRTHNLSLAQNGVYHAVYLEHLTTSDLSEKIADMFSVPPHQLSHLYVQGPSGIQVLVTDAVVANFSSESRYSVQAFPDEDSVVAQYIVHLRSAT